MSTPTVRGPSRAIHGLDTSLTSSNASSQRGGYSTARDDDVRAVIEMLEAQYGSCVLGCPGMCLYVQDDDAPPGFSVDAQGVHQGTTDMLQSMRLVTMLLLLYQMLPGGRAAITQLHVQDVTFAPDGASATVLVPERVGSGGKRLGATVVLQRHTDVMLCPVRALRSWIALLKDEGVVEGPLFRSLNKRGDLKGSPAYPVRPGDSVEMSVSGLELVVVRVCVRAQEQGYLRPGKWGPISFWRGAAAKRVQESVGPQRPVAVPRSSSGAGLVVFRQSVLA